MSLSMRRYGTTQRLVATLGLAALLVSSCAAPSPARPRGVVLMIGDGLGFGQVALARRLLLGEGGRWSFEHLPITAIVSTWSASNATTDSGAAATSMSAGIKTGNQRIGTDSEGAPVTTVAEAALGAGWAVGYATTTSVTHATPAAYYAHVANRYADEGDIAVQLLAHPARVVLGGGRGAFLPEAELGERLDGRNLLAEAEDSGWTVWGRGDDLDAELPARLLGLFANHHFAYRLDDLRLVEERRDPSLARLTEIALEALSRSGGPFFLLVEGGRIDQASHSFDAAATAHEVADFDGAVAAVVEFRERHDDVLVLVTADHATGGLAINDYVDWEALGRQRASVEWMAERIRHAGAGAELVREMTGYEDLSEADLEPVRAEADKYEAWRRLGSLLSERNGVTWIPRVSPDTWGHTGEDVPLYAAGPGAERFQGVLDNTEIAGRLFELIGLRTTPFARVAAPR